jgi:hypothetical protein
VKHNLKGMLKYKSKNLDPFSLPPTDHARRKHENTTDHDRCLSYASSQTVTDTCLLGVEEHSPAVYELDTTDLSLWNENVEQRAKAIIDAFLKVRFRQISLHILDISFVFLE